MLIKVSWMGELEEGEGWVGGGFSLKSSVFAKGIFVLVPAFTGVRSPEIGLGLNGGLKFSCGIPIALSHLPPFFALVFPPQSSEIGKKENFP
jgi:hypothetical protein